MFARLLPNGSKLIPRPAVSPNGLEALVWEEIGPEHTLFKAYKTRDFSDLTPRDLSAEESEPQPH